MAYRLCKLGVVAGLIATSAAISPSEIPSDLPVSSLLSTAQAHLIKGETHEALVYYDAAISRDPSNYLSIFKRGATYLSLGKTSQATDDFNKVLEISPGFEGAHTQLAKIKAKTADWDGARAEYNAAKLAADSPEIVELEGARGAAELAQQAVGAQQWDDCAQYANDAILVASRSAHLRELRAKCRFERNELEEGIVDLRHILNLRPGDTQPHVTASGVAFYGLGDMDGGMEQIRKCLHSDPESKICKKIHKKEKAISKNLKKVAGQLEKGQTTTAGRSLVGTSDDAGLITDIKEQVDELREDGSMPSNIKSALYQQVIEMTCQAYIEGNHKDVAKYCEESIELDGNSFWGLLQRGKAQLKAEDYEASIRTLNEAAKQHPDKREKVQPILRKAEVALKRSKTKDYYKVLGVAQDADVKQIKSAYRKASKQFHPDKAAKNGFSKEAAEKKMASINEAYEVLSDPELRARFDRGDDPNDQESQRASPFQQGGHPFMHNFGGGGGRKTQFHFGGQGGRPGGGSGGGWPFGGGGGGGGFQFNF